MPVLATLESALRLPLPLEIFLTAWFFCFGGCVGSFMNVVIFRVPRGRSVVSPGSRCPQCNNDIRWYDNLPVVSWLVLRGRCRDCQTPISARYPIVEFIVGLLFMGLAVEAFVPGGPWWLLNVDPRMILATDWPRLGLAYTYYMVLACTLICAAYIAWDGQHVPWRLYLPVIIAGATVPLYWTEVRPLGVSQLAPAATALAALREGAYGAALGFILGLAFDSLRDLRNAAGEPRGRVRIGLSALGWILGSRAVMIVMPAAAALALVWLLVSGRRWRSAASAPLVGLAVATAALILAGRLVFGEWPLPWLSEQRLPIVAAVATLAGAALLRWLSPPPEVEKPASAIPSTPDVMFP